MGALVIVTPVLLGVRLNLGAGREVADALLGGVVWLLWVILVFFGFLALTGTPRPVALYPAFVAAIAAGGIILLRRWRRARRQRVTSGRE